jgi:hypothetical protein
MHGTAAQPAKTVTRGKSKIDELREKLAIARQNLVEAVSERSPESVLRPLRNKVGQLLERIERHHLADRFRR